MAKKTRQPRLFRLVHPPNGDGVGMFCIRDRKKYTFYTFRELPCDIGGRGFAVHRLGVGDMYHVRIGTPEESSCECLGFLRHGHCKHVTGLLALFEAGQLPD